MSNNKKVPKKIYVDEVKYEKLKNLLEIMNITITDFFDDTMTTFIDSLEHAITSNDKDLFLQMMSKNLDVIQEQLSEELKK